MEELEALFILAQRFGGGGWVVAIVFLWMFRHDVLTPIHKHILSFDVYFDRFIEALKVRRG